MIKEIFLAIALGALLGFGITGSYVSNTKKNKKPIIATAIPTPAEIVTLSPSSPSPTIKVSPTTELTTTSTSLTVTNPLDETIVSNSLIELKGQTVPSSLVFINSSQKSYQIRTDEKGWFSQELELDSGLNNIQIDAFDPSDNQTSATIQVTYSTAKI
ncbi:MAG: hypothetical protein WAV41_03435 [Microgenomates group bacterium]